MTDRRPEWLRLPGKWPREHKRGVRRGSKRPKTARELIEQTEQYVRERLETEDWR